MGATSVRDPIEQWVNQPIPEKLWHYTSIDGFSGIISSGGIYATDVRFLNDAEEFVHARRIANEVAEQAAEIGEFNYPLRENLRWLVAEIFKSTFLNPSGAQIFVASFSDSEDDLSQWRAYSHGSCGASIAFDLRAFRPSAESDSAVMFAPCVYADDEKRRLIGHALDNFTSVAQGKWNETIQQFMRDWVSVGVKPNMDQIKAATEAAFDNPEYKGQLLAGLRNARISMFRLSGLLKHRAFHHEREWRLVLPVSPDKDRATLAQPIRHRSTANSQIPYIQFPLQVRITLADGRALPDAVLPVNDVMLGPGADSRAIAAARDFLKSHSIAVEPRLSDVPYRQP
jgi:hypothetical protein